MKKKLIAHLAVDKWTKKEDKVFALIFIIIFIATFIPTYFHLSNILLRHIEYPEEKYQNLEKAIQEAIDFKSKTIYYTTTLLDDISIEIEKPSNDDVAAKITSSCVSNENILLHYTVELSNDFEIIKEERNYTASNYYTNAFRIILIGYSIIVSCASCIVVTCILVLIIFIYRTKYKRTLAPSVIN